MDDELQTLPDYLAPGLALVLVGINPSRYSAQVGHYFANPRNRFWRAFNAAGLTPEPLSAETDHRALEFGIGFTDLVKRPTPGMSELRPEEYRQGAAQSCGRSSTATAPGLSASTGSPPSAATSSTRRGADSG